VRFPMAIRFPYHARPVPMRAILLRALVALAVLLASAPLLAGDAGDEPAPPKDKVELRQELEAILAAHGIPGMGVAVADRSGAVWASGLGKASVKDGADATADTLFRTGSISKMFVGLAALVLVSEGRLSLDAPVRSVAPEVAFDNPWESTDPVRVVHLMEHTTGWDDIGFRAWSYSDPRPATLKEGLDFDPESRRSRWPPGTRYAYSNAGPAVAAYVIEKIAGQRYEDFVAATFFAPLGMRTATFFLTPESDRLLTRLYRDDGRTEFPYFHFLMRPSGSLNASPREMGRFVTFLLDRGKVGETRILPEAALDRMEAPATGLEVAAGLRAGYGLGNYAEMDQDGFVWHGHNGGLDGTRSQLLYLPEAGAGYFVSLNAEDGGALREMGKLIQAYLTKGVPKPALPPVADPGSLPARYAGFYELENHRDETVRFFSRIAVLMHVGATPRGLVVKGLLSRYRGEMVSVSPTLYRRPNDPLPCLALLPPGPGAKEIYFSGLTLRAVPSWLAWTQIVLTALSLILMISAPLFALVWIPRKLLGRMKGVRHVGARVWPLLAVVTFAIPVWLYIEADFMTLGARTPSAMAFTACTVLFAVFSLASLVSILRVPRREVNLGAYLHTLLCAAALSMVTVYLFYWGVIGVRTWV
jgi:CubicO group peptidase (beta-lactamase class C family)